MAAKPKPAPVVPKKPSTAVATTPSAMSALRRMSGAGMENVTSKDLVIPRLLILQSLSPELIKSNAKYMKDAKVGDFVDSGTGTNFGPNGITFIPVFFSKAFIEWWPRASGKGIYAVHDDESILDQCEQNERGQHTIERKVDKKGTTVNIVIETLQMFGLNVSAGLRRSFISFAGTQQKKCKRWLTMANAERLEDEGGEEFVPPLFFREYKLTGTEESNAEGAWIGWKIERGQSVPERKDWERVLKEATSFLESLRKGEARADASSLASEGEGGSSSDGGKM